MDVRYVRGPPLHVKDLHDAGHIWQNDEWILFLDFDSGYGKKEISAIWQKFLPSDIKVAYFPLGQDCRWEDWPHPPSIYDITQKGILYDQNEPLNAFIKLESLFDPFLVPKTTFFENLAYFGLFSPGFAFRFYGAHARASILKMTRKSTSIQIWTHIVIVTSFEAF